MQKVGKRLWAWILAAVLVIGAVPLGVLATESSLPFKVLADGQELTVTEEGTEFCDSLEEDVVKLSVTVPAGASSLVIRKRSADVSIYPATADGEGDSIGDGETSVTVDLTQGYLYLDMDCSASNGEIYHLYIHQESSGEGGAVDEGGSGDGAAVPFTVTVNGEEMTGIVTGEVNFVDWSGETRTYTSYTVTVPQGATEAVLTFEEDKQCTYYAADGNFIGFVGGDSSMTPAAEHTVAMQDENGDGEIDGVSVQIPDECTTEYYIQFVYGEVSGDAESCLTVLDTAPTAGETTVGALYMLEMRDVFAESAEHEVTYSYVTEPEVVNQHTKLVDGTLYFTDSETGEYKITLTAKCDEVTLTHTVTVTVGEASEGIEAQYSYDETAKSTVTVYVTLSNDGLPIKAADGTVMANLAVTVPYFDLSLYGLEDYYRYGTDGGKGPYTNDTVIQRPTGLHLYIYLLERYYMGLPENECCLGTSGVLEYAVETYVYDMYDGEAYESNGKRALLTSGGATSIYMVNFWGHDENLMYFRNHCYPFMGPGWGSTSDYILLSDGDAWDVGMFTNWSFNRNGKFACFDQDVYEADPGEEITVSTLGWGTTSAATDFEAMAEMQVVLYDSEWTEIKWYNSDEEDGNTVTFTVPDTAGTYYILGLDGNYGDAQADVAPAAARIVVGGTENGGSADVSTYYEDYPFISLKDDQDRYLVDITASEVDISNSGSQVTIPIHQVTVAEGTEKVYATFGPEETLGVYFAEYEVDSRTGNYGFEELNIVENKDGSVTVEIPIGKYCGTGKGIILEDSNYAWKYGFDFTVGEITEVEVGADTPVSRILLNDYAETLVYNNENGNTLQLTATVLPAEATGWELEWSSGDETVATVDENGFVTAVGEGETVITAAIGEISASCTITSEKYNTAPTVVSGTVTRDKIKSGEEVTLDVAAMFTDAQGDGLTYTAAVCEATGLSGSWEYAYTEIDGYDTTVTDGKFSVSFPEIGIYAVKLTASDGKLSATLTYQFTVVDNDAGVIHLNDGVTMDIFNVVVVGYSSEFKEDFEIPYKGTHDTTIHHIVLSRDTVSGGPNRKMDVTVENGYQWGQYGAAGKDTYFTTRADIGVFAADPNGTVTAHFLQFHTECGTHTDANHDGVCETCTLDFSCGTCGDEDGDTWCDTCGKLVEAGAEIRYGDLTGDGNVDNADVSAVLLGMNSTGLADDELAAADVNGDGNVDNADVSLILQYINGVITSLSPAE